MNRLWVRLTLAFLLTTLIGVGSVIVLVDWSAGSEFRQYVARQGLLAQNGLIDDLAAYYQEHGSWQGVETVLQNVPGLGGRGRGSGGGGARMGRGGPSLTLADSSGRILYDERGTNVAQVLGPSERASAIPIQVNGSTVGLLLAVSPGATALQPSAQAFLDQLRTTLLVAGLIAGLVGIGLGLVLSRNVSAPLATCAQAARAVAGRRLDRRVPVKGADEIAEVARAFNEMADELQASDNARRNMVADIAHELRTPLAVMEGNLRALLDGVYPLQSSEIATLYDESRQLSRLVDDLGELALADAGKLPLHSTSFDVTASLKMAAAQFAIPANEQQVQLNVETTEDLPRVHGDPDRVMQVLRNLLSNALRYTPPGGCIDIRAEHSMQGQVVRINVHDTGRGISDEDLGHVFERFYRSDPSRARGTGNSGLGLAIAKAWVEAMGGSIGVESASEKGTTIWFTLPIAEAGTSESAGRR